VSKWIHDLGHLEIDFRAVNGGTRGVP
jgi:hypothetical protein